MVNRERLIEAVSYLIDHPKAGYKELKAEGFAYLCGYLTLNYMRSLAGVPLKKRRGEVSFRNELPQSVDKTSFKKDLDIYRKRLGKTG